MSETLLIIVIVLLVVVIVLQATGFFRKPQVDLSPLQQALQATDKVGERAERAVREEIGRNRTEAATVAQQSRQEMALGLKGDAQGVLMIEGVEGEIEGNGETDESNK